MTPAGLGAILQSGAGVLIRAAVAFCLLILCLGRGQASLAQTQAQAVPAAKGCVPANDNARSETTPFGVGADKLVLKDGQAIAMRSTRRLSSETAKVGETVQFKVIKPIALEDLVVISEHAIATGRVVTAETKKRRLRAGKLTVVIECLAAVTGQTAPLRPTEVRGTESRDYGQHVDPGPGAIFAAPVILLATHGSEMVIPMAARATTYLDGDLVLDREAVQKAQADLPKPRADVSIVYVYRDLPSRHDRDYPGNFIGVSCGEALLGMFRLGQFVGLQLVPGQYWLRAGVPVRVGARLNKKYLDGKLKEYFTLCAEPGHSYYVRLATRKHWEGLQQVDEAAGKEALFAAESWADLGLQEITAETLSHLLVQPKVASDKSNQSRN